MSDCVGRDMLNGICLPVMEDFYTIQGEGFHSGKSAYFVRLGGCDVGCHWCDVKESWDATQHPLVSVDDIVSKVLVGNAETVVVTGGEPLMYNLTSLTEAFRDKGVKTFIETSGTHPFSGKWDWVCLSPKKFKPTMQEAYQFADELKVIVYNKSDLEFAEQHAALMDKGKYLCLQPEWSRKEQILPLLIDYVKLNPKWCLSIQTHKYINIP